MPDIKLVVDVDIDESSEKFEKSLKQVIKNVEDKIPQIKLNFDSKELSGTTKEIDKVVDAIKELDEKMQESMQKGSSAAKEAAESTKTLAENETLLVKKYKQVDSLLSQLYEKQRKYSGAGTSAKKTYSVFGESIEELEKLKKTMGDLTFAEFDNKFSTIGANLANAEKTLSRLDEKTKVLTASNGGLRNALKQVFDLQRQISKNAENWSAAENGTAAKAYSNYIGLNGDGKGTTNDLINKLKSSKIAANDFALALDRLKSFASQYATEIQLAGEATKAAVGTELVSGTKGYEDALRKVDTVITTISTNTKNWTAASEGTAKSAYASYSGLVDELNTVHKCIETGQLTREEFQLWMSQIGSKAAAAAKEIKLAGENMKLPETLEVGSKKYSSALNTVNGLLKQVESNTKKWTLAQNGNSKTAYESYANQATALRDLSEKLRTGKMSETEFKEELDKIISTMRTSENIIRDNGEATSQLSDKFSILDTTLGKTAIRLASMYLGFQKFIQLAKQMVQNSIEIESAMNRLQIVTGATDSEMKYFFSEAASQAKELGKNIVDVAGSIETFSRLGYTLSESSTLSKFATIMANVADTSVEKATTGLTSIIKGYGLQVSEAEHVADVLVNVGQKYAISAEELMEAFERGGAALHASGASFEQSAALFAAANAALQNAANVGTMWKTVSARIRGSKTELDELGESMDDLVGGFSKYREEIKALSGVDIMIDDSHFKDTYEIFVELANVWDKMEGDTARARIAEILGGTRQLSGIASTIQNISDAIGAYNTALDSNSVAVAANNKYMETTAAHIEQLKTSFQELSYDFFNSDLIKNGVDFLKGFVEVVDFLTKHIGSLNTALIGIGAVKGIKALMKNFSGFKDYISMFRDISNTGDLISHLGTGFEALAGSIGVSAAALGSFLAIVGGIFIIRTAIDLLTTSYEELRDQATRTSQALKSTQSEIADVESKIEETRASIEKLEGKHLDAVEQAAYDRLVQYNNQLEIQLQLLKDTETIQKEAARDAAVAALTSKSFTPLQPTDLIGKIEAETWRIKDMELNNVPATDATYVQWVANRADHIKEAMGYFDSIRDYEGELTGEIKDLYDRFLLTVENSKSDEKIAQEKAEKKTKAIQSILSQYSTVYKAIKDIAENKPYGISMSDVYSASNGGFADAISAAGATMVDVANEINKTNGALDEAKIDKEIKQLFHYSTLVSGAGTGVEQAFKAFKGMSDVAQVAAYNALKGGGFNLGSWTMPDFVSFFNEISNNLYSGKTYIEYATENFEELNENFNSFSQEVTKYQSTLETVRSFDIDPGNSIASGSFYSAATVRAIQEEIASLSKLDTEEAKKKIAELQESLSSQMILKDYSSALVYDNGVLKYNLDLVKEITEAKNKETIARYEASKAADQTQYLENAAQIRVLRQEIENTDSAQEKLNKQTEIAKLLSQNSDLANEIQHYDLLSNSITEATDAYHEWILAQSATDSGKMFEGAISAFNKIDEILNDSSSNRYLQTGHPVYEAALNFVIPESIDTEDEEAVNNYLKSIGDYFIHDENGNAKGLNIDHFLSEAVRLGLMTQSGDDFQIAGQRSMQEFAEGMAKEAGGLAMPVVQAMFDYLKLYDFEFEWFDDARKTLGQLQIDATEAAESLKALGNLKDLDLYFDTTDVDVAVKEIDEKIKQIQEFKAKPDIDTESLQNANTIIEYLVRQKQSLQEPLIMSVDTEGIDAASATIIQKLQEFQKAKDDLDSQIALGVDETTLNASKQRVSDLASEIDGLNKEFNLGITDTSIEGIEKYISEITEEKLIDFGIDRTKVKEFMDERLAKNNAVVIWGNDDSRVTTFLNMPLSKYAMLRWNVEQPRVSNLPSWSQANGTANANGNWGNKHAGKTLVGEVGTEIVVVPSSGKWYTVGDRGAEFVDLPRGAIVFNHKQSKSLLENGTINSRGQALGGGTPSVSGGGSWKMGLLKDEPKKEDTKKAVQTASNNVTAAAKTVTNNSNNTTQAITNTTSSVEDKTDTILEKFKEWASSLFDWVEVRISRLTDKIEKTVAKAERNLTKGNYNRASSNYTTAINETLTLISNEQKANTKYSSQAASILAQAVSRGVITQTQADSIRARDKSGLIDISEYSDRIRSVVDEYQNWMDKAREASSSISELHDKIVGYVQSLKEVRDAQRDAKLGNISNALAVGNGGNASSYSFQNRQLLFNNTQLRNQNSAYSSAVKGSSKDLKTIRSSAASGVNKQLKTGGDKKYVAALNAAKSAIKAKKVIPSSTLNIISKNNIVLFNRLSAYNLALGNLATAREENALNYAESSSEIYSNISKYYENKDSRTNDKISLLNQKSENATSASSANKYLNSVAKNYRTVLTNDRNEINKFTSLRKSNAKTIKKVNGLTGKSTSSNVSKAVEDAKKSAKAGKYISPTTLSKLASYYEKGYVTAKFYQSCVDYNNAHDGEVQARKAYEIDQQTTKATLAELGVQKLQNVQNAYGLQQSTISSSKGVVSARQSLRSTKGISMGRADYKTLRNYAHKEQLSLEKERTSLKSTIRSNLKGGLWTKDMKEYKEALNTVRELEASILKSKEEQVEYNNAIAQLPYDTIEKAIDKYDALEKYLDSVVTREQAKGNDLSEWHYTKRIEANNKMMEQYAREREQALSDYGKALANKDKVYGGKSADEYLELYRNLGVSLNNLIAENEKLADELRDDVYWRTYERAHKEAKRLQDVLNGISELLSDDMYFSKDGMITRFGIAKIAELTKQYELARTEVENYIKDINHLNELYKEGAYDEGNGQVYIEKLAEFRNGLLDAAKGMKQYLDSIKDMYKTIAQEELDRLFKLIDARSEALDKKKAYYDYDKTIRDKTKDIRSLESQIAALEGVSTTEAKAQRARLMTQLAEANEDLEETQRDHALELSKESLDGMKTTLQEEFDNKWDNLSQDLDAMKSLLEQANRLTEASTSTIDKTLDAILSHYGVDSELIPHASGTKRVRGSHVGLSMEKGNELLVTKYGIISKFNPGDGIVPADLTERLYTLAQGIKPGMSASKFHGLKQSMNGVEVTQNYGSLINIEGSADAATVEDLKNMSKDLLEKSYNYTSKRMTQDYARTGGRRKI